MKFREAIADEQTRTRQLANAHDLGTVERFHAAANARVDAEQHLLKTARTARITEYVAAALTEDHTTTVHLTYSDERTLCNKRVITAAADKASTADCPDCLIVHARNTLQDAE